MYLQNLFILISLASGSLAQSTTPAAGQCIPRTSSTTLNNIRSTTSSHSSSLVVGTPITHTSPSTTATTLATSVRPVTTISTTKSISTTTSTTKSLTTTTKPTTAAAVTTAATTKSTTTSAAPIVTDQAYIDTVIRHHNVHRTNSSANPLTWSASLADTARKIAQTCQYQHNTTADGGGYGQNIGAGFLPTHMGQFITDGLYNSEVNSYTYYGGEPDYNTLGSWGHFTQIVWKGTSSVGCYTNDCSATGLSGTGSGVPPYFSVCNYGPSGNYVGEFANNVGKPIGNPTVYENYMCPSAENCVNS